MATFAVTLDNGSVITFEGNLTGDIVSGLTDWTQDGTTAAVTVTLTDPDVVPLTFKPPSGATDDGTDQIEVYDDTGAILLFAVDASGDLVQRVLTGASFNVQANDGTSTFRTTGAKAVGFYGATPVAQQTGVAVTAAAIHAALVSLGLITA